MNNDKPSLTHTEHQQYRQSLGDQVNTLEQEARMILPGIQTLFGFQMISVFSANFKSNLSETEQAVHLIAMLLVALAAILVVSPAAYHRQAKHQISEHFIELSSFLLALAMPPLALGTCLDIYLVAKVITGSFLMSLAVSSIVFLAYAWTWFILPWRRA